MTEFDLELEDIYNQIVYYPNKIYEIFCDFYGEEYVDLQNVYDKNALISTLDSEYYDIERLKIDKEHIIRNYKQSHLEYPYILVWFPKLKITNEYDESVEVEDFWAKINITYTGKMHYNFLLNRSTYLKSHIVSDYMHSHVAGINSELYFRDCCLGTGPIKNTCHSLNMDYDESLWQLFCFELSKYVQTESIAGVPYRKMANIKSVNYNNKVTKFSYVSNYEFPLSEDIKEILLLFTKSFLQEEKLKFNYFNDSYGLRMPFLEYMLTISNCFIEWYNDYIKQGNTNITPKDLYARGIINKVKIADNSIYTIKYKSDTLSLLDNKVGNAMFIFKGKTVTLKIIDDSTEMDYTTTLNISIATAILNSVLKTLNYNYE